MVQELKETDDFLKRDLGHHPNNPKRDDGRQLPTSDNVDRVLDFAPYDTEPWHSDPFKDQTTPPDSTAGFRKNVEFLIHNPAHQWVGGSMDGSCSSNDPVFWLHHCNIDRLWAKWQTSFYFGWPYLPPSWTSGVWSGHGLDDPMPPWEDEIYPPTPRSVLNHHALGYQYDTEGLYPYIEKRAAVSWQNGSGIRIYKFSNPEGGTLTEYTYDNGKSGVGHKWTDNSGYMVSATEWGNGSHLRVYVGQAGNGGTDPHHIKEYGYNHGDNPEWKDDGPSWDMRQQQEITGIAAVSWENGDHVRVYYSASSASGDKRVVEQRYDRDSPWSPGTFSEPGDLVSAISWDPTSRGELQIRVYVRDQGKIRVFASWDGRGYEEIVDGTQKDGSTVSGPGSHAPDKETS